MTKNTPTGNNISEHPVFVTSDCRVTKELKLLPYRFQAACFFVLSVKGFMNST
jgi:hypothetical protein